MLKGPVWNLTCDKSECLLEENGSQTVLIPFPPTTMKIWALCCVLILDLDPTPQVTDSFKAGVMAQRLEVCLILHMVEGLWGNAEMES